MVANLLEVCLLKRQLEKANLEASYLAIYSDTEDVLVEEVALLSKLFNKLKLVIIGATRREQWRIYQRDFTGLRRTS